MKKVYCVVGAQNTGKSTFIRDLRARFPEMRQVGCDYRKKIAEAGLKINREGDIRSQRIILGALTEQLDLIAAEKDGTFLTDRSPVDCLVYTTYLFRHSPSAGVTQADLDEMFETARRYLGLCDGMIFLDLDDCGSVKVVDDRFRDTDAAYRVEIDSIFKEVFARLGRGVLKNRLVVSVKGGREERVAAFEQAVSSGADEAEGALRKWNG